MADTSPFIVKGGWFPSRASFQLFTQLLWATHRQVKIIGSVSDLKLCLIWSVTLNLTFEGEILKKLALWQKFMFGHLINMFFHILLLNPCGFFSLQQFSGALGSP